MCLADTALEQLGINVIRGLAMDAPRAANSGHPGTAMALAPLAHVLWTRIMRHDPSDPAGPTATGSSSPTATPRSCCTPCSTSPATGSTLDDLRAVPPVGAAPPGTPRIHHTAGRRGHHRSRSARAFANGVGMGIAERFLRARFGPRSATTTPSSSPATAASRRASATRRPRWPATSASAGWSTSTTTTTSPSTGRPSSPTRDNVAERFEAYGWHVDNSARWPTTSTPSRRPSAGPWRTRTGRRCSSCAATSASRRPS